MSLKKQEPKFINKISDSMSSKRPYILGIAGHDPSGGAGVLADIKTFEAHKLLGLGVTTCITYQNENEFTGVDWLDELQVIKQLDILLKQYHVEVVKIGLIKNIDVLEKLIDHIFKKEKTIKIIWDPILKASAGFEFHNKLDKQQLERICKKIFLITPNWQEANILYPSDTAYSSAQSLATYCNVFLKGGHNEEKKGRDYLFSLTPALSKGEGENKGKVYPFKAKLISAFGKHGSGCVLSSAIAANLAKGFKLHRACLLGKNYVTSFLLSNKTKLGYHKI